jgi:CobQ-like glutamine amidotransferase family enzyme
VKIRVAHLYPDYLNIYADRGNIAVFARRAALRGHSLEVTAVEPGDGLEPASFDLIYIGGGQDREQALVAPDLAERGDVLRLAVEAGTALLAVCGGYQLLGRGYRSRDGSWLPGAGLFPLETVAGERRLIGDVLLEVELDGMTTTVAPRFRHDRTRTRARGSRQRRHLGPRGLSRGRRDRHLSPRPAAAP